MVLPTCNPITRKQRLKDPELSESPHLVNQQGEHNRGRHLTSAFNFQV